MRALSRIGLAFSLTAIGFCVGASVWAGRGTQESVDEMIRKLAPQIQFPVYVPPPNASKGGRIDGFFRGQAGETPSLFVLAPKRHVGWTMKKQPTLYWFLSEATSGPIRFTLEDPRQILPVLDVNLYPPVRPGVQRISLEDYDVSLDPQVSYRWHITLLQHNVDRPYGVVGSGMIEYIEFTELLVIDLAKAGLWYDAIDEVSRLIEEYPSDPLFRLQRAALMNQEDLPEVALFDLNDFSRLAAHVPQSSRIP